MLTRLQIEPENPRPRAERCEGFSSPLMNGAAPVLLVYGERSVRNLVELQWTKTPIAVLSVPVDPPMSDEDLRPYFKLLKSKTVAIWPTVGLEGQELARRHAATIASLGAEGVCLVMPTFNQTNPPSSANIRLTPDLKLELIDFLAHAFTSAEAIALPAQGDRKCRAIVPKNCPESGQTMIKDLSKFLQQRIPFRLAIMSEAVALWCIHTWCVHHQNNPFDMSPRLILKGADITSAQAQALRIVSWFMPSPQIVSFATAPQLLSILRNQKRSLLIDDVTGKLLHRFDLRTLIAAGSKRDGAYLLGLKRFPETGLPSCFSPVAIATCGEVPDDIQLHSLVADIGNKADHDSAEYGAAPPEVDNMRAELQALANQIVFRINREEVPQVPSVAAHHRKNWFPLLAIAQTIGKFEDVTVDDGLKAVAQSEADAKLNLLRHLKTLFDASPNEHLTTASILESLNAGQGPSQPNLEPPIDARQLAEKLGQVGLRPVLVRVSAGNVARGYRRADLLKAFDLALPEKSVESDSESKNNESSNA